MAEITTAHPTAGVLLRQQGSAWPARVGYTRRGARRSGDRAFRPRGVRIDDEAHGPRGWPRWCRRLEA
jgi:hypothetical protein